MRGAKIIKNHDGRREFEIGQRENVREGINARIGNWMVQTLLFQLGVPPQCESQISKKLFTAGSGYPFQVRPRSTIRNIRNS